MKPSISAVKPCSLRFVLGTLVVLCAATPLLASRPYLVDQDVTARLQRGAAPGQKLILDRVPVVDGDPMRIELERFEVWAPDARIVVYEADGKSHHTMPRPSSRYYKGHLQGDAQSTVVITVEPEGKIEGTIFARDRFFTIARGVRRIAGRDARGADAGTDRDAPLLVREFDPVEDLAANPQARGWSCGVDGIGINGLRQSVAMSKMAASPSATHAIAANGTPSSGASYGLVLGMETDGELWAAFGSDGLVTSYLGTLVSQASVIYQRDLKTTLTIGTVHLWQNAAADPWTVPASSNDTFAALAELGTYWHNNFAAVNRSSVVFVSGKAFFGGVAWVDTLCAPDFACGGSCSVANSFGGGYAFCAATNVVTISVPDPTQTINGVQYGLPSTDNFWMLLELVHELGHNANGKHTHCIPLDATQQTLYGVPGRTFVDSCFSGEFDNATPCYAGATSAPVEKGTIMSYCHNFFAGGFPQSRYLFYQAGQPSELEAPFLATGLNNGTTGLDATITVSANLPCSAGQTASVPLGAATYNWQISGGSITLGQTSRQITFTPTGSLVTVTATVGNVSGCTIINASTVSSQCVGIAAPTNVIATATGATTVSVTWTAVTGATFYTVYRSANNTSYVSVGTPTTNSLSDTTALANTAYLYKVTATGASGTSPDSNRDLATTIIFTDPTLPAQSTTVKAVHLTQLRSAVAAVRALALLSVPSFTDPSLTSSVTQVKRLHLIELRTNLDAARTALGLPAITYTDSTVTAQLTPVKAVHIAQLRGGVQ